MKRLHADWYILNAEAVKDKSKDVWRSKRRNDHLLNEYGITEEEYNILLEKQRFGCAICGGCGKRPLAVDHDHATGIIRGLLCDSCNIGLGNFQDSPNLLNLAIQYLK